MGTQKRSAPGLVTLLRALEREPYRFGFLSTLRRLECTDAEKPRLGRAPHSRDELLRIGQDASTTFEPASLVSFRPGPPHRLDVAFPGLLGPNGPLPLHLTEYARDRARHHGDRTLKAFLDLFNHRMLTLFYRAWADAQPTVNSDRPGEDRFRVYVGSACGRGTADLWDRDAMPEQLKLGFAGRLGAQTRNAAGLEAILQTYLGASARIEPFQPHWMPVPARSRWRLGSSTLAGVLNESAVPGARVWDCQYRFRIRVGPLDLERYREQLPCSSGLRATTDIVRNYQGDELQWDLQLVLNKEEVPTLRLGGGERLGWTTWLPSRRRYSDPDDLCIEPMSRPEVVAIEPIAESTEGVRA